MTMTNMDLYFINKGFTVFRKYIPSTAEYKFELSKNGINKTYYWKYDRSVKNFEQYQKESMDAMIKDLNEKAVIDNVYKMACNSLFGSIDSGYVYNPESSFSKVMAEEIHVDYSKFFERKTNDMARTPKSFNIMNIHPVIKDVIFNEPATIVLWDDGTKTVVKTQNGEVYDPEKGIAMAVSKKIFGNCGNYYNNFKPWLDSYYKEQEAKERTIIDCLKDAIESINKEAIEKTSFDFKEPITRADVEKVNDFIKQTERDDN